MLAYKVSVKDVGIINEVKYHDISCVNALPGTYLGHLVIIYVCEEPLFLPQAIKYVLWEGGGLISP